METIRILNRRTSALIFEFEVGAEIASESTAIKLGFAVKAAIKSRADLREADLSGAHLRGADLSGAHLRGADLRGADLREADLREADLRGAHLRGAHLRGADLREADLIHGGIRSDGYEFFGVMRNGDVWIKAGCRWFDIATARTHWQSTRADTQLGNETTALLDNIERLATIRGWLAVTEART